MLREIPFSSSVNIPATSGRYTVLLNISESGLIVNNVGFAQGTYFIKAVYVFRDNTSGTDRIYVNKVNTFGFEKTYSPPYSTIPNGIQMVKVVERLSAKDALESNDTLQVGETLKLYYFNDSGTGKNVFLQVVLVEIT